MTYQVFVSNANINQGIADEITESIVSAFGDDITVFVAGDDIHSGEVWDN